MSGAQVYITKDNKIQIHFTNAVGHVVRTLALSSPQVADQLSLDLLTAKSMVEQ